ncbi:M3 family metallopeptidase [Prolixibacter bellariivorans]|nr:M3 family metallopeptidase [Prolixibacter bellariivorans]
MKKSQTIILIALGLFLSSTVNAPDKTIAEYLNQKEKVYEKLCMEKGLEVWNSYTNPDWSGQDQSKEKFMKFFGDAVLNNNISQWYHNINSIKNDTLRRRVELWHKIVTTAQVNFDPKIIRLQSKLEKKLSHHDYSASVEERKKTESEIEKLIHLRNEKAKSLGYGNYAYMVLQNTGIDTVWFEKIINLIDLETRQGYVHFLSKINRTQNNVEYADIRPYLIKTDHLTDLNLVKNEEKQQFLEMILNNIGIDMNKLPIRFTFRKLPPGLGGFGDAIEIPNDSRAVARKELSFYYLLHEIGHGLQWTHVKMKSPVLKGYEWCMGNIPSMYYEGMAETVAKFSDVPFYLKKYGYTKSQIDSIANEKKFLAAFYLRYKLVNSLFEIELYKDPTKSAAEIKHELFKKYLFVDMDFSKKPNLIMISYVSYPVYEQNYLFADIISWQIHQFLKKKFGKKYYLNKQAGEFLVDKLWQNGELIPWQNRIENATGKNPDIEGYLKAKKF